MNAKTLQRTAPWVVVFFLGFAIRSLVVSDSVELTNAKYRLGQAEAALAASADQITSSDLRLSFAMNERQRNGEYILKFERPVDRKLMQAGIRKMALKLAMDRDPSLRGVLSSLGIERVVSDRIEQNRHKIFLASLETEMAMQQLALARQAYDNFVHSVLNSESYKKYREYEDSQLAVSECGRLQQFAKRASSAFDPAWQNDLVTGIEQTKAYSQSFWHGPYDSWPQIAMGQDEVIRQLEQESRHLQDARDQLGRYLVGANLPKLCLDIIGAYYEAQIQNKKSVIEELSSNEVSTVQ